MKIVFYGAAQTVTGSQFLLQVNGHRLLLECGLYQGRRSESYEINSKLPFQASKIDAAILSHAHLDHSGNLPNLIKNGFEGPIYTTPATAHLSNVMLMDSAHIQESDASFVNKKKLRRGELPVEPLYTQEDAAQVAQYFYPYAYEQVFEPVPGVAARLVDAGHILGSAGVSLEIEENGKKLRLWFSGDIGRRNLPLLRDPVLPGKVDYLMMECTYGDKPHREPELAYEEMRTVIKRTVERGGKVIIPAFAVGRTQEIVYNLHQMIDRHELPRIPVFVDSPLAVNATTIFRQHPECFDQETREFVRLDKHHEALGFDLLTYTRSVEESKALNDRKDPMVIISASGMAEAGRILHHLRNNIENPKNTVMIVSWQAPYTLGRRLADRETEVSIFGEVYQRKAEVATIGGLSAHAGQNFLLEYAEAARGDLKKIFLIHGEQKASEALQSEMAKRGLPPTFYPEKNSAVEI
jgi:metallo-beta-lactamase family protein